VYHPFVVYQFYVHNFRCLENFKLPIAGRRSLLLIGKNGAGKTTVGLALEILQRIARGTNRVAELVKPKDLARGRKELPMRFEIAVELGGTRYGYDLAFEFPDGFKELRVREETLTVGGEVVFSRELAKVYLAAPRKDKEASFSIDWHLVALPIIQERSEDDPIFVFKRWLARMLIFRPMPSLIRGDSKDETLEPNLQVTDFGSWFSGLLAYAPSAYSRIDKFLRAVMPDFTDIKNPIVGAESRSLTVQFLSRQVSLSLPFEDLSDGEKCFMIGALVIAANQAYGPILCFWDEPDNYLAPSEVQQFVMALRRAFESCGQLIATSHSPEGIRSFSNENTLLFHRNSHLEPTTVHPLDELQLDGDLVGALTRGDLEP
jgi:predicted ATPase